jgi:ELWxxDGT repeat protein
LTVYGNKLYFQAQHETKGNELWSYNGNNKPKLAVDIRKGGSGSFPDEIAVFKNSLYFNATTDTSGSELWKYTCKATYDTISVTQCSEYTVPSGDKMYDSSGTYQDTLTNYMGCDSLITINLTMTPIDTTVDKQGSTLSSNANGDSYQWFKCNNGYTEISGETGKSFEPDSSGSYAVEITKGSCVDTSKCVSMEVLGIDENTFAHDVSVYPNPTQGRVTINMAAVYGQLNVQVTDLTGRVIQRKKFNNKQRLNLHLVEQRGVYIIKVSNQNNKRAIMKVLKQ